MRSSRLSITQIACAKHAKAFRNEVIFKNEGSRLDWVQKPFEAKSSVPKVIGIALIVQIAHSV